MGKDNEKEERFFRYSAMDIDHLSFEKIAVNRPSTNTTSSISFVKKYKKEDIRKFISDPKTYQVQLREISRSLYNSSAHYKRLIDYLSNLATMSYIIEPYNIDFSKEANVNKIKKNYPKVLSVVENMNIRHEFIKVMKIAFREDVFYGYEHETSESYYIQKLNPEYCMISSVEDGVFNFSFNFKFFDTRLDLLESYPEEFRKKYLIYKNSEDNESWIELDAERTICIKINEDIEYPVPPLCGVFEAIYDIEAFKALRKAKEELSNFKVLVQKIPLRKDSDLNNDFSIDYENVMLFHNKASKALPPQVGLISTPFDTEEFSFDKDRVDSDNVAKSERDFWSSSGVSQLLFNTDKSTSAGLKMSIQTDEEMVFAVLRQIERWINRKLKRVFKNFRINILDITIFNKGEVFEQALKSAQFGFPVKHIVGATLGLSPSAMMNMAHLENDVLEMQDHLIPVSSSHTQTAEDDEGGRPEEEDDDLSEEGQKTRDEGKNKEYQ